MTTLITDIKYSLRRLTKTPGFTLITALTLAVGIGANVAMFSMVHGVLLRSLPFKDAERLTLVAQHHKSFNVTTGFSYPSFTDFREQNPVFDDLAAYNKARFDFREQQGTRKVEGAHVSGNFFSMLGISAVLGRTFTQADEQANHEPLVMIDYSLWQERFGGSRTVLDQTLVVDNRACRVVGVLPAGFQYPIGLDRVRIWSVISPATQDAKHLMDQNNCWLSIAGPLNPTVTTEKALSVLNDLHHRLGGHPESEVKLSNLRDRIVGDAQTILLILSFIVGFILLIVCANVASLCMARSRSRDKELAIRQALGANRWHLLRQFITESTLLSSLGGVLGLLVTFFSLPLIKIQISNFMPMANTIRIEPMVLAFTIGITILVGMFLGVTPFACHQRGRNHILSERNSTSNLQARFSHGLVVAQIALALILSIGLGLMGQSMKQLKTADTGFNQSNLVTFKIDTDAWDDSHRLSFCDDYLTRLTALPAVQGVATDSSLPCSSMSNMGPVSVEGYSPPDGGFIMLTSHNVNQDYFKTLQMPILQGRTMTLQEQQSKARVVLINESLAQRFWPGQDPLGRELTFSSKQFRIIGIVPDVVQGNVKGYRPNQAFFAFDATFHGSELSFAVRTESDPGQLAQQARAILTELDANLPLYDVSTFTAQLNQSINRERFTTTFLTLFASIAMMLVTIGLYGVISYVVTQRTREIGIRMALGARKDKVLIMVLKQGMGLWMLGTVIGVTSAIGVTRYLKSYLYQISATDPMVFTLVPLLIAMVSLIACWIPARRASKIDPMEALRYE